MIFVTGATGNVGREVVTQLLREGKEVRALSRDPSTAALPVGAEVIMGDISDSERLESSLAGVESLFLMLPPQQADMAGFLARAKRHVQRAVFMSSSLVRDDVEPTDFLTTVHAQIERAVIDSGLRWSIVRPGAFAANARRWWATQMSQGDVVRFPYARAQFAPIHEGDIAAVVTRALIDDAHHGKKYELTGPAVLTFEEQVRILGEVLGRPLRLEELTREGGEDMLRAMRFPDVVITTVLDGFKGTVTDAPRLTDTVERITGAPARSFRTWAKEHAASFPRIAEFAS